jgi:hypothetical protein
MIYNYYFAIFILALLFFLISNKNVSILLSIIIIIIIGYYYFGKINEFEENVKTNFKNKIKNLNDDIKDKNPIIDENYYINKFPIELRYLKNDKNFIELILKIRFIKLFDDAKYTKLLLLFENFMKIYIFMLADRYEITDYFTTFLEIRQSIIKELYGIYVIIPIKLRYIFNVNTFETIKETIHNFIKYSRRMILIIENYAYKHKGLYYLPDTQFKPYEKNDLEVF